MNDNNEIISLISNDSEYYGLFRACSEVRHDGNRNRNYGKLGFYLNDGAINTLEDREYFLQYLRNIPLSRSISIDAKYLEDEEVMQILNSSFNLQEIRIINEGYVITNEVLNKLPANVRVICDYQAGDINNQDRVVLQEGIFKRETNYIEDRLVSGYFINRELSDSELDFLISIVNQDQEGEYRHISFRIYDPKQYARILTQLHERGLKDDVRIQFLGNPLYDKVSDYEGLDSISNNPISIIYDTCSDMIEQYQNEPFTVSSSHHSELEGGGLATLESYFHLITILEEQERHIQEKDYSPLEAMLYGYRYLQQNYTYDPNYEETDEKDVLINRQLDLVAGSPTLVCVGYATLYSALMRRCGIPVFRYSTKEHVRNIGRLVDPKYGVDMIGILDPTWDCSNIDENGNRIEADTLTYFMLSPKDVNRFDEYITLPYSLVINNDLQSMSIGLNEPMSFFSFLSRDMYEATRDPDYFPEGYAITMLDRMGIKVPVPFDTKEYKDLLENLCKTSIYDPIDVFILEDAIAEVLRKENPEYSDEFIDNYAALMSSSSLMAKEGIKNLEINMPGYSNPYPFLQIFDHSLDVEQFNKESIESTPILEPAELQERIIPIEEVETPIVLEDVVGIAPLDQIEIEYAKDLVPLSAIETELTVKNIPKIEEIEVSIESPSFANLPDNQYLSVEDSLRLANERGVELYPGGRYHISLLTEDEKKRYTVASAKISDIAIPSFANLLDDQYLSVEDSLRLANERGVELYPGGRYHISLLTEDEKKRYTVASAKIPSDEGLEEALQLPSYNNSTKLDGGMSL